MKAFLQKKVLRQDLIDVNDAACLISTVLHSVEPQTAKPQSPVVTSRDVGVTSRASTDLREHRGASQSEI